MEQLNHQLFLLINATPESPEWLIQFADFIAVYAINIITVVLLIGWLWLPQRKLVLKIIIALAIAVLTAKMLPSIYPHSRPFVEHIGHQFLNHSATPSFPSSHGTIAFTFALAFILWGRISQAVAFFSLALMIAWARVYLGVHWPLDMLAALLVSLLSCAITQYIWSRVGRVILVKSARFYRYLFGISIKKNGVKY